MFPVDHSVVHGGTHTLSLSDLWRTVHSSQHCVPDPAAYLSHQVTAMMTPSTFDTAAHHLLEDLEVRHDQLLRDLDDLNARVDAVLAQYAPPRPPGETGVGASSLSTNSGLEPFAELDDEPEDEDD